VNILAFDTTLGACSAAVARSGNGGFRVFGAYELRNREHAEVLMPMIGGVLDEAGLAYDGLDAIAVTIGPGSFTGVRVGVAAARGFALALNVPLIALTSLEVMARQALDQLDEAPETLIASVDARRSEVYIAMFDGAGNALSEPAALSPEQAAKNLPPSGRVMAVGSGAALLAEAALIGARNIEVAMSDLQPDARMLAEMALEREPTSGPVSPLYLRPPDAKPQSGKAIARRD